MKFNLKKFSKATLIGVASLALIVPLSTYNLKSADAFSFSYSQIMNMMNKDEEKAEPAWKAQDEKYRPILKGYHGDMDEAYDDLNEYYSALQSCPWVLDDLGRRSRVSPRWWVDHGGSEGITEFNRHLHSAINKPKGYHGPNSLRGVPFGHQRKHRAKRHIQRHRTRRNRRHAVRRHNRKHRVNRHRHGKRNVKRSRRNHRNRRHRSRR